MSGYRVVDLSDERGLFCGHVLGQLGAEVIHVEAPGERPRSMTWQAYARGHRSVALDLDDDADRKRFFDLIETADAVLESADPGTWEERGLGYEVLAARNPALVWVSMTPFGSTGPKANYAATDLIVQAAAGTVDISGAADRAPLRTAGVTAWAHAGAEAAGGALIALAHAQRSGLGQRVEVSAQRAYNLAAFFTVEAERIGHSRVRRNGGFSVLGVPFPFVWECADGYVSLTIAIDPVNRPFLDRFLGWMAEEGEVDPALVDRDWVAHVRSIRSGDAPRSDLEELIAAVAAFVATRTKAELLSAALDRRLLLVPVSTLDDMLESPQMAARGFWRDETLADGSIAKLPAHLVVGAPSNSVVPAPAPSVGQHDEEVLGAPTVRAAPARGGDPGAAPLAGLNVLDLMWVMAGPTSTGVLAQYGATVVRVENAARIDTVRLLAPYYEGKAGRERSMAFACINVGKLSITLDPNNAEAREVILDLVRWADVVTESFSPRAMRGWGLDYESLRKVNPDLIMLSSCLFGQEGPYAFMAGYGTMGGAIGGLVQPTGWPDRPPLGPYGAYTDVCSPRVTVAALLAAVDHRDRTGEGAYLDQSQIEASLHYMLPAILDRQVNGTDWDRLANTDPDMCPHGVYPSAGDDEWVAIAVRGRADWEALAGALGRPDLADDATLIDLAGRRAREAELDSAISAWTSARSPQRAEDALQALGVPAHAVVHAGSEPDPQLAHLGHTVTVPHTGQPDRVLERTRIELTRTPPEQTHVPALGEHTDHVLGKILGYDDARIIALRRSGALGGEPVRR